MVDSEGFLPNSTWQYGADSNLRLARLPATLGPNVTAEGLQYVYEFSSEVSQDGFWQDLNATYMTGATYEFSVGLSRGQNFDYKSIVGLEFRTSDNVPVASKSLLAGTLLVEEFGTRSVELIVPSGASYEGDRVRIGFRFSGTGLSPAIDAVSVCATPPPM